MESKGDLKEKVRLCHLLKSQLQKKKSKLQAYKRKRSHAHKVLSEKNNFPIESDSVQGGPVRTNTAVVTFAPETQILNLSPTTVDVCSEDRMDNSEESLSVSHQAGEEKDYSDLNILFEEDDSFFEDSFQEQDKNNVKNESIISVNSSFDIFSDNDVPIDTEVPLISLPKLKEPQNHQADDSVVILEEEDMFRESSPPSCNDDVNSINLSTAVLACFKAEEFHHTFSLPFVRNAKVSMDMDQSLNILYLTICTEHFLYLYKSMHNKDDDDDGRVEFSKMKLIWKRMISSKLEDVVLIHENNHKEESGLLRLVVSEVETDLIVLFNCYLFNNEEALINCLSLCLNLSQLTQINFSSCFVANNDRFIYCSSDKSKNSSIIFSIDLPRKNHHEFRKLSSSKMNFYIVKLINVENSSFDEMIIQDLHYNLILIRIDTKTGDILSKLNYKLSNPIDRMLLGSALNWGDNLLIVSAFVQYKSSSGTRAELFVMQSFINLPKQQEQQVEYLKPIPISQIDFARPLSFDSINEIMWISPSVAFIVENQYLHCRVLDWVERCSSIISLSVTDEILSMCICRPHLLSSPSPGRCTDLFNSFVSLCFESGDIVLIKLKPG